MNANNLKVEFINWLIKRYKAENIILGNEVLFSVDKCRADIVMLKNNKIFAYELKSDSYNWTLQIEIVGHEIEMLSFC